MTNLQNYEAKQAARAFAAKQLQQANPHLIANDGNSLVIAAKNIRIELKRAFPAVAFRVTTKRFSMGNSISVKWIDGPTSEQVDRIINKYSAGSFDGMTDCYNYESNAWTEAFGSGKYVSSYRDFSDKMLAAVIGRVCRNLGGVDRSIEQAIDDWKKGNLWNVRTSGGCDLSREINVALSRHTYCVAKA